MNKKQQKETFLVLGPAFIALGMVFSIAVNKVLGIAFLAIGVTYTLFGINKKPIEASKMMTGKIIKS